MSKIKMTLGDYIGLACVFTVPVLIWGAVLYVVWNYIWPFMFGWIH